MNDWGAESGRTLPFTIQTTTTPGPQSLRYENMEAENGPKSTGGVHFQGDVFGVWSVKAGAELVTHVLVVNGQ